MSPNAPPEVWLRGPIAGVPALLMPAAHCLLQCREEIEAVALPLPVEEIWTSPGGAATAGFHLRHIAGSIDRLLTYAAGAQLDQRQRSELARERAPGDPPATAATLVALATGAIDKAVLVIRATTPEALLEPRAVGRAALPSNVLGLLFHVAEHTHRHTGQLVTTVKVVQGLRALGQPSPR